MKIKITIDDILEVINTRASKKVENLYTQRAPWLNNFDFEACEHEGHDPTVVFDGIVSCDDEWACFITEASTYIKNKEYGYSLLVKDLRKDGYMVSRSGNVFPK
jgi:hypothetical protein